MNIRKYKESDREAVEHIHFATGHLGKPMNTFLQDNKRWKRAIAYYLDKEPKSSFVATQEGRIIGYLLGCLDNKKKNDKLEELINAPINYLASINDKQARTYWGGRIRAIYKALIGKSGELHFHPPTEGGHLHINLLPEVRGKKGGSKLLEAFEKYAKKEGVRLIHANSFKTKLNPNTNFWKKNGFEEYCRVPTSFWQRQHPKEKIELVSWVKKL